MIWKVQTSVNELNLMNQATLIDHLNIIFTELGSDYLIAEMTIGAHHMQPFGIMHGGASCVLAETVGSVAANLCVDPALQLCVGLDININHIKAVKGGVIQAKATPLHIGRTTQVWDIKIQNIENELIAISRLTTATINKKI